VDLKLQFNDIAMLDGGETLQVGQQGPPQLFRDIFVEVLAIVCANC
jgi:hypothetical protein